jgi:queuine tRNA-ribosyltransferase
MIVLRILLLVFLSMVAPCFTFPLVPVLKRSFNVRRCYYNNKSLGVTFPWAVVVRYATRSTSSSSSNNPGVESRQPNNNSSSANVLVIDSPNVNGESSDSDDREDDDATWSPQEDDDEMMVTMKNFTSKQRKQRPIVPPPLPSDFPDWAYEPRDFFKFEIIHESTKSRARVGRIHTPHGIIDTPGFVAVATNGALKGVDFRDADDSGGGVGQQLVFSNTYHLLLHPGPDVIQAAGGIHKWTNRNAPFITDSGGFQVFSLAHGSVQEDLSSKGSGELKRASVRSANSDSKPGQNVIGKDAVKVTEDGVLFRSYRDGSRFLLTPETTIQAQKKIGADIIIPLDELPGYYTDRAVLEESVDRTHRWEARSLQEHLSNVQQQAIYCVVHGGLDVELREKSVEYLTSLPFDGFAIGGSLGNGRDELKELLTWLMPMFDEPKRTNGDKDDDDDDSRRSRNRHLIPRHLLGIADEVSIRNAVSLGIDTLDSAYPTRLGRHGTLLSRDGHVRIQKNMYARAFGEKIDADCTCKTCQHYDRAYLWHLFKANEPLAVALGSLHNIHYINNLMSALRQDILDNRI